MVRYEIKYTIKWSANEMMVLITSACGEGSNEPACQGFRFSHKLSMNVEEDSEQFLDI